MDKINDDASKERPMDTYHPLGRLQHPACISVTGKIGDLTLVILDGCFAVSVHLTPSTARALAEQLLAHVSRALESPAPRQNGPGATP